MAYGVIDKRSRCYYTYLADIFSALNDKQKDYNWLITDCEIAAHSDELDKLNSGKYHFIDGDELTHLVEKDNSQWIWGVLCGFDKNISLDTILEYKIPSLENPALWEKEIKMLHPRSSIDIIPFDSSFVIIQSATKDIIELIGKSFPECEDLQVYNSKNNNTFYRQ